MKNKQIKDIGASVRARLLDLARKTGRDFDAVLVRYFQERFLYRLSRSPYERYFRSSLKQRFPVPERRCNSISVLGISLFPAL